MEIATVPRLLLTPAECAESLGLSEGTIFNLTRRAVDPLPAVRVGRAVRYSPAAIQAWIERQAQTSE